MAALNKIAANSPSRQQPSELETSLANALTDLETNTPDLKVALRPLQFVSAREVRTLFFWVFLCVEARAKMVVCGGYKDGARSEEFLLLT